MRFFSFVFSLLLISLCFVMACDDEEGPEIMGDIQVRINNQTGEAMTDLQIGFFGYDNLHELGGKSNG